MTDLRISKTFEALTAWAKDVETLPGAQKVFLFGSLINDSARDFQIETSDLDLVLLMNDESSSIETRLALIQACEEKTDALEGKVIKALGRDAVHPHTSLVCLTPKEAYHGIHKSGDTNLLFEKQFVAIDDGIGLQSDHIQITTALDEPGFYAEFADELVGVQYAQKVRNEYLSNSFNGKYKGLLDHSGDDPLPKQMLRTAAIMGWKELGEDRRRRTDLTVGIRYIQHVLKNAAPFGDELSRKLDGRLLGRGQKQPVERAEILMLSELLFDVAITRVNSRREQLDGAIDNLLKRTD